MKTCSISAGSIARRGTSFEYSRTIGTPVRLAALIDNLSDIRRLPPRFQRACEIEKARDEEIGAVDFRADDLAEFARHRIALTRSARQVNPLSL